MKKSEGLESVDFNFATFPSDKWMNELEEAGKNRPNGKESPSNPSNIEELGALYRDGDDNGSFFKGLAFAIPISVALWAIIIYSVLALAEYWPF